MYDCYIFDLDGTLLDTLHDLVSSTNFALRRMGFAEHTQDEIRMMVGNGVERLIRRAVPADASEEETLETLNIFRQYYMLHSQDTTAPYDGVIDVLKRLKHVGKHIAVVSNKFDAATKDLCRQYFPGLVEMAIGEDEKNGIKKKPSPDTVNKVIESIYGSRSAGVGKSVYIGDSDVDVETARNAGIPCISVLWGFRSKEFLSQHGATTYVSHPSEIS